MIYNSLCEDNDKMSNFVDDFFIKTNDENDKISKDEFLEMYNEYYKSKCTFKFILNDIKRIGLSYNRSLRCGSSRGGICGIKLNENIDDDKNDNKNEKNKKGNLDDLFDDDF